METQQKGLFIEEAFFMEKQKGKKMTKLPDKTLLDGSKLPKTTTGEMKTALGDLRDYLANLLGEDSADLEKARQSLGIDLAAINEQIDARAVRAELDGKAGRTEMADALAALKNELLEKIGEKAVPAGTLVWFGTNEPPAGYLKADGSVVERQAYPALFAAIGTIFGEGDGETTFRLPDLIGRFAEGSATPGTVKKAGLPNITGQYTPTAYSSAESGFRLGLRDQTHGAFSRLEIGSGTRSINSSNTVEISAPSVLNFDASRSNPIYGASDTVQPPALTLLPCIRT